MHRRTITKSHYFCWDCRLCTGPRVSWTSPVASNLHLSVDNIMAATSSLLFAPSKLTHRVMSGWWSVFEIFLNVPSLCIISTSCDVFFGKDRRISLTFLNVLILLYWIAITFGWIFGRFWCDEIFSRFLNIRSLRSWIFRNFVDYFSEQSWNEENTLFYDSFSLDDFGVVWRFYWFFFL